jgi:hypothetical protein
MLRNVCALEKQGRNHAQGRSERNDYMYMYADDSFRAFCRLRICLNLRHHARMALLIVVIGCPSVLPCCCRSTRCTGSACAEQLNV